MDEEFDEQDAWELSVMNQLKTPHALQLARRGYSEDDTYAVVCWLVERGNGYPPIELEVDYRD